MSDLMPKQVLSKHLIAHTGTCKTGEEQTLSMGVELQRPLLPSGTRHWKAPESIEILKAKHKEICCMDLHLKLQTDSRLSCTSNCTPIQTLCVNVSLLLLHWERRQNIISKKHCSCKKPQTSIQITAKALIWKTNRMATFVLESRTKSRLPLPPIIIIISCKRHGKEQEEQKQLCFSSAHDMDWQSVNRKAEKPEHNLQVQVQLYCWRHQDLLQLLRYQVSGDPSPVRFV